MSRLPILDPGRMALLFGLFLFMFPPHIKLFGIVVKVVYVSIFLPSVFGFREFLTKRGSDILVKKLLLFMGFGFIFLLYRSGMDGFDDLSAVREMVMGVVILFAAYFYYLKYQDRYGDAYLVRIYYDLYLIGVFHSTIVIATFLFPEFKGVLYQYIEVTAKSSKFLFNPYITQRFQGIVHSGFSFLSTTHALLFCAGILSLLLKKEKYGIQKISLFLSGLIVILLSIGLIGRTGFVVVILFFSILLLSKILKAMYRPKLNLESLRFILLVIIALILLGSVADFSKYAENTKFAFEFIINYYETGNMSTHSTDTIIRSEIFFPGHVGAFLFGTGNFGRGSNFDRINSDVGYVLFIYGAGVIGMLIAYSFYLLGGYFAFQHYSLNPDLSLFMILFIIMLAVVNVKDYYFISYSGYTQIYFITFLSLAEVVRSGSYKTQFKQYVHSKVS